MKTISFSIANYCVPCHAHCRYCLLSSCGKATGVKAGEGMEFTRRVLRELDQIMPDLRTSYYIGYCMDTPDLPEYIQFCREFHSPAAGFLQMNGFAFREEKELLELMSSIRKNGVELIDLTFYGKEEYHDRFAGRPGDYQFLIQMLDAAGQVELPVCISIPLLRENLDQMTELYQVLSGKTVQKFSYYLPHSKGRGRFIQDQRITRQEFDSLPNEIRNSFQHIKHMTESEWISSGDIRDSEKRSLTLVLTPENIDKYSKMPVVEILKELENLDDQYLREMLSARELADRYGDPNNQQLFRLRDLLLKWQQQYISDSAGIMYDMHDETHHFSIHL